MEQIIYVDPDDEITTLLEKLRRAREKEIVLVATERTRALETVINLRLLQRRAQEIGAHVALAVADRNIRQLAQELGFTVAASLEQLRDALDASRPAASRRARRWPWQRGSAAASDSTPEAGAEGAPAPGPGHTGFGRRAVPTASRPAAAGLQSEAAAPAVAAAAPAPRRASRQGSAYSPYQRAGQARAGFGETAARAVPRRAAMPAWEASEDDEAYAAPPRHPRAGARLVRLVGAIVGVLVLLALTAGGAAAYLFWPSADITLTPAIEPFEIKEVITADPQARRVEVETSSFPARIVQVEVRDVFRAETTGRKVVPDGKAQGQVVFVNQTTNSVEVPQGTILATAENVKFQTVQKTTIPPTIFAGPEQRFGTGRVGIIAVEGGTQGNVDKYKITRIEGDLASKLQVMNDTPTSGGSNRTVRYVTAEDRQRLQSEALKALRARLDGEIAKQYNPEKETLLIWPERGGQNPAVMESTFNKNSDEEADRLELTMKLRLSATAFQGDHVNQLMTELLAKRLGQAKPGYRLLPDSVKLGVPELTRIEPSGAVVLTAAAAGQVTARVDVDRVREALLHKSLPEAERYLRSLPGVASYRLEIQPEWYHAMPRFPFRISVRVEPSRQLPA